MGVIEALKKGFNVAVRNPGLVLVIFAFSLISNLISVRITQIPVAGRLSAVGAALQLLIFAALVVLVDIFLKGGILAGIRDYIKEGKTGLTVFAKYGLKYYLRLLGLDVVIVAAFAAVILTALLITSAMMLPKIMIIAGAVALLLAGIGLYWVILLAAMSPYAVVCEELPVMKALAQSVTITRKGINKITLLFLITILISLIWMVVVKVIPVNSQILRAVLAAVFGGYFGITVSAGFMLLYLSLITNR
ncbi:MAG: hypothetical protein PHI59_05500 [Candidatus Omnitrophica bacterium]|nr:hypothetical protein [Candidatus Omnitrophota bacterium]